MAEETKQITQETIPTFRTITCPDCECGNLMLVSLYHDESLLLKCQECGGVSQMPLVVGKELFQPPQPIKETAKKSINYI